MFKIKLFINVSLILIFIFVFLPCVLFAQEDLDTAISKLADKITQHMAEKQKTKIAVIPFQDLKTDMVTTLGKYIAEELTTALFNSGKFNIIERNLLNKVLDELKLSQTGAVDPSSAKELGKITGVDAVVTGTIQDLINRVAVNCRLIETETGNIFAAASEKIIKDETIAQLLEEVIESPDRKKEREKKEKKKEEGPLIIKYENKIYKREIRDYLQKYLGYSTIEVISATINKNSVTFTFLITNNTKETLTSRPSRPSDLKKEAFISDKYGNRFYCISTSPPPEEQVVFPPRVPVKGTMAFSRPNKEIDFVNLSIKIRDYPLKYAVFHNLELKKD